MEVLSALRDTRIDSTNFIIEMSIQNYLSIAKDILKQNEYQRKRVKSSQSIYSLLKEDILKGCVIPPIVLALTSMGDDTVPSKEEFHAFLARHKNNLLILDGLQRTYSMLDVESDLNSRRDEEALQRFYAHKLRLEIYVGINRLGILYRMLTLNTGQTPMSLRQQIEMLYLDYSNLAVSGIELIREAEGRFAVGENQYNFRDIVEGFISYLERNELPIERSDLLENIKSLEKLSLENATKDIFKDYLESWHSFMQKINQLTGGVELQDEFNTEYSAPFGKTAVQIFKKPQTVSGFGAAVGKLKDFNIIQGFEDVKAFIPQLTLDCPASEFLFNINKSLDWIKNNSKKIGNAQRMFFHYYFRELFNQQSDSFKKVNSAVTTAFHKYMSQNF